MKLPPARRRRWPIQCFFFSRPGSTSTQLPRRSMPWAHRPEARPPTAPAKARARQSIPPTILRSSQKPSRPGPRSAALIKRRAPTEPFAPRPEICYRSRCRRRPTITDNPADRSPHPCAKDRRSRTWTRGHRANPAPADRSLRRCRWETNPDRQDERAENSPSARARKRRAPG